MHNFEERVWNEEEKKYLPWQKERSGSERDVQAWLLIKNVLNGETLA